MNSERNRIGRVPQSDSLGEHSSDLRISVAFAIIHSKNKNLIELQHGHL